MVSTFPLTIQLTRVWDGFSFYAVSHFPSPHPADCILTRTAISPVRKTYPTRRQVTRVHLTICSMQMSDSTLLPQSAVRDTALNESVHDHPTRRLLLFILGTLQEFGRRIRHGLKAGFPQEASFSLGEQSTLLPAFGLAAHGSITPTRKGRVPSRSGLMFCMSNLREVHPNADRWPRAAFRPLPRSDHVLQPLAKQLPNQTLSLSARPQKHQCKRIREIPRRKHPSHQLRCC